MRAEREKLGSRLGFILLSAACAIGIGNVWRFPYVAGQSGGGGFVVLYLACLALLGLPVLLMEFAAGRAARRSIAHLHAVLTPGKPYWRVHGLVGSLGLVVLMMFYTVVTAWMILYFLKTASGAMDGLTVADVAAAFGTMRDNPWPQIYAMTGVCLASVGICAIGLRKGLERVTKWMMLALLLLIVVLAVNSLTLDGAGKGLAFYLVPNLAGIRNLGLATVLANALQQAFFTLSLGIGSMAIFGSYIGRERTLLAEGLNVVALDTFVALCAGLVILPACSAFGVAYVAGPSLVFVTLPNIFNQMANGRLWGALFFLFMSFAALTTVLAVFEGIIAALRDYAGWGRGKACLVLGAAMPVLSLPCILGFNVWRSFHPLGGETTIMDLEDFLVSDLALPFGGLAFALYCTHRFGWGWEGFRAEVNAGAGPRLPNALRLYCAYVLPAFIAGIIVIGLIRRFG
ncbi:MAG: sodium-dependent transporter [Kiritimatiellia bacterium]